MRVAIVGAGAAGLASARHVLSEGIDCDVLEMTSELGGIWVYTDDVGEDQDGFPVYSAMYKGLKTNLAKEIMGFPDYPMPEDDESYITQVKVLEFLNQFADHFKIRELIKFNRMVTEIRPFGNKWQVQSIDKPSRQEIVDIYDAVMVCNGHYNEPVAPKLPGQELFKGTIEHSQEFRSTDPFKDRRVLVVGAGPSSLDVTLHVSDVAQYVVLSHHSNQAKNTKFPSNVSKKPDVLRIKGAEEVEFLDGSSASFDAICLCTGYKFSFPFLHESCGVTVEDKVVRPLYKHMIHVDRPTLCFIGIPFYVCAFQMFDIQARFYCKYLKGLLTLPSPDMMRKDIERDMQNRRARGFSENKAHYLGENQQYYFDELATIANITSIEQVYCKLWDESVKDYLTDFENFRKTRFKIIDNKHFVKM